MDSISLQAKTGSDGILRLEIPVGGANAEVTVVVQPSSSAAGVNMRQEYLTDPEPGPFLVRQTSTTGINAVWGTWPGEETEDELLAALEDLG